MGRVSVPLRQVVILSTTARHGIGQASAEKRVISEGITMSIEAE
jgi:hypothetical protein